MKTTTLLLAALICAAFLRADETTYDFTGTFYESPTQTIYGPAVDLFPQGTNGGQCSGSIVIDSTNGVITGSSDFVLNFAGLTYASAGSEVWHPYNDTLISESANLTFDAAAGGVISMTEFFFHVAEGGSVADAASDSIYLGGAFFRNDIQWWQDYQGGVAFDSFTPEGAPLSFGALSQPVGSDVPETASTAVMLALGLGGLALAKRRAA